MPEQRYFYDKMKSKQKSKKAQAHIEMIISFALFIGILLFFFFIIKPLPKNSEVPIETIEKNVLNQLTSEVGTLSVITSSENDCYSLDQVKDDYGTSFIEIHDVQNPKKYTIYFHSSFTQSTISCISKPENFQLGVYTKQNLITESGIITFKQEYESNYQNLKQELGITNDFSFSFSPLGEDKIPALSTIKYPPTGVDVIVREFPVQVINNQGQIQNMIFNLRAW